MTPGNCNLDFVSMKISGQTAIATIMIGLLLSLVLTLISSSELGVKVMGIMMIKMIELYFVDLYWRNSQPLRKCLIVVEQ